MSEPGKSSAAPVSPALGAAATLASCTVVGLASFATICRLVGTPGRLGATTTLLFAWGVALAFVLFAGRLRRAAGTPRNPVELGVAVLVIIGVVLVASLALHIVSYLSLPVDLLTFSESPFVNDVIKLRTGVPIYTSPTDHDSYPYAPGTQLLTWGLAAALGGDDSIPFLRVVQFGYVLLAAIFAAAAAHALARQSLPRAESAPRALWTGFGATFLLLVATDPRINLYVHSLHNDGLAMLVSSFAFWLLVKSRESRSPLLVAAMIVIPAVGFLVKQSVMLWLAIFWLDFFLTGRYPLRRQLLFVAGGAALVVAVVTTCVAVWGDDFVYWVFEALGEKVLSPARSVLAFLAAGTYVIMGLFAGWVLALRDGSRTLTSLWLCWLVVFLTEATTSGLGWQVNHMGPGVLIGSSLFVVALMRVWPRPGLSESGGRYALRVGLAITAVVCLIGSLGLVRRPLDPVPADFARYVSAIEREFAGRDSSHVLADNGSWVYLRDDVVMKDRASPMAIHAGMNQPEINRPMLEDMIGRIAAREYERILVRHLGPGRELHTTYDYQDRGSGVKDVLLEHYQVVRTIPGVSGIKDPYWLKDLYAEVWVFEPK